jgi:arylsulfatase A-like enzyme
MGNKAIRAGDWKLVTHRNSEDWELYNLADDRTEMHDRCGDEPARAIALLSVWRDWAGRMGV